MKTRSGINMTGCSGCCVSVLTLVLVVVIVSELPRAAAMPGAYLCHAKLSCLNGGTLRVPDNPFDFCRCVCPKHFAGLRCEFNQKLRRINRLKRLVRLKQDLEHLFNVRHLR